WELSLRGGAARTPGRAGAGHAVRTTGRYLLAMALRNSATGISSRDSSPGSERTNPSQSGREAIRSPLRNMALIGLRAETRALVKLSLLKDKALNSLTHHTKMGLRYGHPDADFFRPAGTLRCPARPFARGGASDDGGERGQTYGRGAGGCGATAEGLH